MDLLSVSGGKFYPNYELKLHIREFSVYEPNIGYKSRFHLLLMYEGHGVVQINDRYFSITAPAVCCLSENDRIAVSADHEIKGRSLYFHPSVINYALNFQNSSSDDMNNSLDQWCLRPFNLRGSDYFGFFPVDASVSRRISDTLDAMTFLMRNEPDNGWPCRCRSYLIEILYLLGRMYDLPKPEAVTEVSLPEESVKPVILYMSKYYDRKIRLEDLSKEFHTNRTSLNERFRSVTGVSIMSWLITLRMQIACSFLRNTTMPVSDVIHRVGFVDGAHFIRAFKKYAGMTPTEYRNLNCWMLH